MVCVTSLYRLVGKPLPAVWRSWICDLRAAFSIFGQPDARVAGKLGSTAKTRQFPVDRHDLNLAQPATDGDREHSHSCLKLELPTAIW